MFNLKYMKHAVFGQTWRPVVCYLAVQIAVLIFYEFMLGNCEIGNSHRGKRGADNDNGISVSSIYFSKVELLELM